MISVLTPLQQDLLVAASSTGDRASNAWERWSRAADLDALEPGAYDLLPLAFRNLEKQNPPGIAFRKAAAIYRHTWCANEVVLRRAARIAATLQTNRIEFALTGDIALTLAAYPDSGARPITSIDILIPEDSLIAASEALLAQALAAGGGTARRPRRGQPIALADSDGRFCQLFATVGPARSDRFTRHLLSRARSRETTGILLPVLSPADLLLITCEKLCEWDDNPALPAFADAWRLLEALRSSAGWDELCVLIREEHLGLTVASALAALQAVAAEPLPPSVLGALHSVRSGRLEQWEYRVKIGAPGRLPGRGLLLDVLHHFREGWWRNGASLLTRFATLLRLPSLILVHLSDYARHRILGRDQTQLMIAEMPRESGARPPGSPGLSAVEQEVATSRHRSETPAS